MTDTRLTPAEQKELSDAMEEKRQAGCAVMVALREWLRAPVERQELLERKDGDLHSALDNYEAAWHYAQALLQRHGLPPLDAPTKPDTW